MDDKTRRMFIELLKDDKEWARNVFSEPRIVAEAAKRGGFPIPGFLGNAIGNFVAKEQVDDLTKGIEVLEGRATCLNPEFKHFIVTILQNDSNWYLRSRNIGYSEFNAAPEEICRRIEAGLDEIKALPVCNDDS
jgi:hypothetical protein